MSETAKVEETKKTEEKNTVEEPVKYYGIQVMGLGRKLNPSDPGFKGLDCAAVKAEDSTIYKYIYGKYSTSSAAAAALPQVRKKFPEAFVVVVEGSNVKRCK